LDLSGADGAISPPNLGKVAALFTAKPVALEPADGENRLVSPRKKLPRLVGDVFPVFVETLEEILAAVGLNG